MKNLNVTRPELKQKRKKLNIKNNWQLYLLIAPAFLYMLLFHYIPIYGIQIAFRDYTFVGGITGSKWVGLKHFKNFFNSYYFERLLFNTLGLNFFGVLVTFLPPIIIAILLVKIGNEKLRKFIQTTIYIPNFISVAVMAGMLYCFLSPTTGIINLALQDTFGIKPIDFLATKEWFRPIYYLSGIWQGAGYGSILYIANLTSIDPGLYEAAEIDGASIWQKIRHIDIPSLKGVVVLQLIMSIGGMLSSNTQKVLLLQSNANLAVSDIIGTYVYKAGIEDASFSYSAAIGLFANIINFMLLVIANKTSDKVAGMAMF